MKTFMIIYFLSYSYILLVSTNVIPKNKSGGIDIDDTKSNDVNMEEVNYTTPKLSRIFSFISKGNDLKLQYSYLLPKLASLIKIDSVFNPFRLISFIPYLMFTVNIVNATMNKKSNFSSLDFEGLNLASVLQNPENLKNLLLKKDNSVFAIDAMKVLAGDKASAIIDKLVEEVKKYAVENRNGVSGINGERLNELLRNSNYLKSLFPSDDLANMGLNYLNAYMDILVSPEVKKSRNEVTTEVNGMIKNKLNEATNKAENNIGGTLSDSVAAFFTVGQKKINEVVGDGHQTLGKTSDNNSEDSPTGLTGLIFNKAPNSVLKYFDNTSINSQYSNFIPKLITYFLPAGIKAFRFMCLVTYVMILAKKESAIPDTGLHKVEVQGLNTEKVIDTLNNQETMSKIFPNKDVTSSGVNIIKFLAGPEAILIDKLVAEVKKITTVIDENGNPKRLTITEVLMNTALIKKLYEIKEYADSTLKKYFGVSFQQLKTEIQDEMKKSHTSGRNGYLSYFTPSSISNTLSATYRVGARKTTQAVNKIALEIKNESDQMTQPPSVPDNESIGSELLRTAANYAPKSVLYGVAGGKIAANKIVGFYSRAPIVEEKKGKMN